MKNKKLLRYLIIATVVLIVFAIIGKKAGWFGKGNIEKVAVEKVEKRTIIETITANGKVQPATEVKISPDVSGEIVELLIKEGDEVKQGDLLLKINPEAYISNLDRMEAAVNSSKSNLSNSKARYEQSKAQFNQADLSFKRQKKLYEQGAISLSEYESAQSAYQVAKADVDASQQTINAAEFSVTSAEASLKEAKENLVRTAIYAPITGSISKLSVEKGERVVGTVQFAGTELLRVANLNNMEVLVNVNENDIVKVHLRDTAIIEVDAYLGKKFKGLVTEIANSATVSGQLTDQVTNFDVKISILSESYKDLIPKDNPKWYPFRPGMSATVDIQTKTSYNVYSVPIQSVTTRIDTAKLAINDKLKEGKKNEKKVSESDDDNNKVQKTQKSTTKIEEIVFTYKDGKVHSITVTTGIQDNNNIEILTGLTEKDEVVIAPYSAISKKLKDMMEVVKVDKEKLFEVKK